MRRTSSRKQLRGKQLERSAGCPRQTIRQITLCCTTADCGIKPPSRAAGLRRRASSEMMGKIDALSQYEGLDREGNDRLEHTINHPQQSDTSYSPGNNTTSNTNTRIYNNRMRGPNHPSIWKQRDSFADSYSMKLVRRTRLCLPGVPAKCRIN